MKNLIPKILLAAILVFIVVSIFRNCDGCKGGGDTVTTTDTTTTTIPGIVENKTPLPVIAVPPVDSSIYTQLERYKRLWRALQLENGKAERHWAQTLNALKDTTLSLESRYNILLQGCNIQAERVLVLQRHSEELQAKLSEAANGDYLTQGTDSTADYRLDWSIRSFAPLKPNGFVRSVTTYQKEIKTTETKHEKIYPKFTVAALYGIQPNDVQILSLQLGKDWRWFGLVSQFGVTSERQPQFSGGVKLNF